VRFLIVFAGLLLASCGASQQTASPSPAPTSAAPGAAAAAPSSAAQSPQPAARVSSGTILACTPIEDRQPAAGQVGIAQPFFLLLDGNDRPIRFEGGTLPAKIPFRVDKIEPAAGLPGLRVGAIIRYAAKDTQHEMYTTLAIMKDGTYQLGLMVRTPTQSTGGPVYAGHGTCVGKAA
jgi:hypothetical protein